MNRKYLFSSAATFLVLTLSTPLMATQPSVNIPANGTDVSQKCLVDLQAFNSETEKDGYWLGSSAYGYGYPVEDFGNRYLPPIPKTDDKSAGEYHTARPGYDVRILTIAANILARRGQEKACQEVLTTTREVYKTYAADMRARGLPLADTHSWWKQQIAAAKPVTSENVSYRSDQLLGIEVRGANDSSLGTVHDIVMNPQTGKIAYLIVARGGIFGIDVKYVPVPWEAFETTPNVDLLVLDTTKDVMTAAPEVKDEHFSMTGQFDQESQTVDTYWKAHLPASDTAGTNG